MSIDELKAAIERRGYEVRQRPHAQIAGHAVIDIICAGLWMRRAISSEEMESGYIGVGEMAEYWLREFSKGQHHVQCSRCKEPLLFTEKYVPGPVLDYGISLERANQDRMVSEYRAVVVGVASTPLKKCPGCGVVLSSETVQEINDAQ